MKSSVFWSAWIFVALGFLPFYKLHDLSLVIVFSVLWLIAAASRNKNLALHAIIRFFTLVSCVVFIWDRYDGIRSVEATAALFALLAVLKLWESHNKRDGFLFFLIFQLMMIAQYLLLESLWLLFFMIISTLGMGIVFMHLQSHELRSKFLLNSGKRKVLARVMLTSLGLAIVLFFVFPRTNFSLFLNPPKEQIHPLTGFSSELRPGGITSIMQDDSTIFRATFDLQAPDLSLMYWHGATLSINDGFNWTKDMGLSLKSSNPSDKNPAYHYEAVMVDGGEGPLFLLSPVSSLKLHSRGLIRWRGLGDAFFKPLSTQKTRWTGAIDTRYSSKIEDNENLENLLQVDPEVKKWVRETFPHFNGLSTQGIVTEIKYLFDRNFEYSMSPGAYNGSPLEQLEEFLTERKLGICEHFASATGIILRSFDHPAVIAVGFHGGEYNELGDYWIIRGRDAHAWVMVYDAETGWQRFDPTQTVVPRRLTLGATSFGFEWLNTHGQDEEWYKFSRWPWLNQISKIIDSTYYKLNIAFINYDAEKQKSFLSQFGLGKWKRSWLKWMSFLIGIAALGAFWWLSRSKSRHPWFKINKIYNSFEKKLPELDVNLVNSMPPLELREKLQIFSKTTDCANFIDSYIKLKYAHQESSPSRDDIRHFKRLLKLAMIELRNLK